MKTKLNLVEDISDVVNPGDAMSLDCSDHLGLVWCCPECGALTSTANGHKHVFDPKTHSLQPSIVHNIKLGGCGWHGWLRNGIFINV